MSETKQIENTHIETNSNEIDINKKNKLIV